MRQAFRGVHSLVEGLCFFLWVEIVILTFNR